MAAVRTFHIAAFERADRARKGPAVAEPVTGVAFTANIGGTALACFIHTPDALTGPVLSDVRSGLRIGCLAPVQLARYVANPYADRMTDAAAARELIASLVARFDAAPLLAKINAAPALAR